MGVLPAGGAGGGGRGAGLAGESEVGPRVRGDHVMSQPGSGRGRAR